MATVVALLASLLPAQHRISTPTRIDFLTQDIGRLPAGFSKPVQNSLELKQTATGLVLAGSTDTTARYQLVSPPIPLGPETAAVRIRLSGRITEGGLYLGLLTGNSFAGDGPVSFWSGAPTLGDSYFPTRGASSGHIVLGNPASSSASTWEIHAIEYETLHADPSDDMEFRREYLGSLPPGFSRPSPSTFTLQEMDGRVVLTGETDRTGRYQLISKPVSTSGKSNLVRVMVEGELVAGAAYVGLLDSRDQFAKSPVTIPEGPIRVDQIMYCPRLNLSVRLVLGNARPGFSTRLAVTKLAIKIPTWEERDHYFSQWLREHRMEGSAWRWALDVLRGKIVTAMLPSEQPD